MKRFEKLKLFIQLLPEKEVFTRTSMMEALQPGYNTRYPNTMDSYRRVAEILGYVKTIRPGVYQKIKNIDPDLDIGKAYATVYPNSKRKPKQP